MYAKVAILCAVIAAAHASIFAAPILRTGVANSERNQDAIGNYVFKYGVADGVGANNSRYEYGDAYGPKRGSYTIPDGRPTCVDYVAPVAPVAYRSVIRHGAIAAPGHLGGLYGVGLYGAGLYGAGLYGAPLAKSLVW